MMGDVLMMMCGYMMKIMFVIVDMDGDGVLFFEEVMVVYKCIFDVVDMNKDGKVMFDEI